MRNKIIAMGKPGKTAKQRTLSALGHFFFTRGFFQTAIYLFTKEIQDRPSARAYLMRAKVYDEKGDNVNAWLDVSSSLKLKPSHDAYNLLGALQLEKGDLTEAEASFNQAIHISEHHREEKESKRIELFTQMMRFRINRGHVRLQLNKVDEAYEDFERAYKNFEDNLPEDFALACVGLGLIAVQKNNWALADSYFMEAIESDPTCAYAFVEQGKLRLSSGKSEIAFRYFSDAIEADPEYVNAYVQRAFLFTQEKNYTAAYQDYSFALRHEPNDVYILLNLARIERSLKSPKTKDAIAHLQHADKLVGGKNPEVLFELGMNHMNDPKRAWAYFHQALLLNPEYSLAQFYRGLAGISLMPKLPDSPYDYNSVKPIYKTQLFENLAIIDAIEASTTDVWVGIQNADAKERFTMLDSVARLLLPLKRLSTLEYICTTLQSDIEQVDYYYFLAYALIHDPKSSQSNIGEGLNLAIKAEKQTTSPKYRELISNLMVLAYKKLSV